MHILAIHKTEKAMGHLVLFSSLEVYGTLSMFDTIFGEKNPYLGKKIPIPSYLCFVAQLKKFFINY